MKQAVVPKEKLENKIRGKISEVFGEIYKTSRMEKNLERVGAVGLGGEGAAKKEEIRDVDVEAGVHQRPQVRGPLPLGVGAEAVEEEERGGGGVRRPRGPAVDDGAIGEGGGDGAEAGGLEGAAIAAVAVGGEAEAGCHPGMAAAVIGA